jgi:hypothetical protein
MRSRQQWRMHKGQCYVYILVHAFIVWSKRSSMDSIHRHILQRSAESLLVR